MGIDIETEYDVLEYTGKLPESPTDDAQEDREPPYLPDPALVDAVNLAIYLKRPLLLKGEAGCGKTRLARAVADELGLPYEAWYVKSISRAQEGFYFYDSLERLRDTQVAAATGGENLRPPESYIKWRPLGRAFLNEQRTVVLIDEIDKADIDFPNDLLLELEEQRFIIQETDQEVRARKPPIVFITSNDEKDLPDAFLRRCLFHYIEFPKPDRLITIVLAHFPGSEKLAKEAVKRFQELRDEMYAEKGDAGKKVSTSELLDWVKVLKRYGYEDKTLAKLKGKLPFASVLLKSWDDHRRYLERAGTKG